MDPTIERDAQEFAALVRKGWRLGLLVARCVEPGRGGRRKATGGNPPGSKVSLTEFARATGGVDRDTVRRHLTAWDRAAEAGRVPARPSLEPGVDPELDLDALPAWEDFYEARGRSWRTPTGGNDEWYTSAEYVEAARRVLGGIDLDPASNARAQEIVRARRHFTEKDNGLEQEWSGRVFLNPPYSRGNVQAFCEKLLREYKAGNVSAAVLLVNAYSADTKWFRPFWQFPICLGMKPAFYSPKRDDDVQPMVWPAVVYLGPTSDSGAFMWAFSSLGRCFDAPGRDRTLAERSTLQMHWDWLSTEALQMQSDRLAREEEWRGGSELPERDYVSEGADWDQERIHEEWELLAREEERIFGTSTPARQDPR